MAAHDSLVLPTPDRFPAFPYDPPYSIQTDLMRHVYSSIERKHVSIVESPTGTVSKGAAGRFSVIHLASGKNAQSTVCQSDVAGR